VIFVAKQKILLVEDDAIEAMDIKRTLESFGYKVPFTASRGEEAVEKARKELPDLILMDIILKGEMNGIETANKIKELEIPIIYLTAHSEEDAVQKAKLTGPYGYLIKPYDPFELRYAIELALYKNQMEKKLKESEKRYKSIVETANEGIWVTDADFNIDYVNPKITEMLGYTAEEMLGKHVTSFLFEEDIPESEKHIEKRIKGHSETYERRFKHKNGSEISTIISVTALMDDNGDFVGSFAMFTDITHRKKMEKALKNRESQLNAIIDGSPVPQFVIDTNHRVMYWNLAMADISGISPEEIIGTCNHWRAFYNEKRPCLADLVVQGNLDNLNKFYPDKYKESEPLKDAYEIEDFFPHLGDGKWLHLTAAAIKDSKGEIIGSLETLNDITDRKMAEKSAIDQYRFLQYLIDTIPYPVFYKDINYVYMGCNKPFEELMGLSKDEIVGKTVYDIIPKDLADKFHKKDKELFHNPRSQFYEEYIPDANGTMHLILNNKTTFQDEKGQVAGLIGIMVDITERKKTENALKESEEKFRVLADNAPISIIVYQMDKVVYANDFAVQMSGYRKEELYTMNVWDNFYLDDQKLMMKKGEARLRGEKVPNRYEVRFITKSGDVRNIDLSAGSIIYDGQPASLITLTDITERKNAERDLHISQFSIDNASDEIYWVDMEASFIYANKSACESGRFLILILISIRKNGKMLLKNCVSKVLLLLNLIIRIKMGGFSQ
jgi:PAS domain S-box-containing protein